MFDPTHPDISGVEHTSAKAAKTLDQCDTDGNGYIDAYDCPYPLGGPQAKRWFYNEVDPAVRAAADKSQFGSKCVGIFNGIPLIPGEPGGPGNPQADFEYLSFKIQVTQGVDPFTADSICAKIAQAKYGK